MRVPDKTLFETFPDRDVPADLVWEDGHCGAFRGPSPEPAAGVGPTTAT